MPIPMIAPSPPPGVTMSSAARNCVARCDAGANATVPRTRRSGVHAGASAAANSAAWPPWEWPATITRLDSLRGANARAARAASSTLRPSLTPSR